ncbi:MAG: GNAT family N-acetyltransferase [Candidatus Magasanikbacteria bacterium]|nr:GNAT family N-acetyltransferase [Candidatus Magasanikbacteria bacterium]
MENPITKIKNFPVFGLTKDLAKKHVDVLTNLCNQIPLVSYTQEKILADSKEDREFFGKWEHSLIVMDNNKPIACLIAYERKAGPPDQYPQDSLYISELAVDQKYQKQGIAKALLNIFLENTRQKNTVYTIQTNEAPWNTHVQNLYKSFGFELTGKKQYEDRTDIIFTKKM